MESTPLCSQIASFKDDFAAQNGQNCVKTEKPSRKTNNSGEGGTTTGVAATTEPDENTVGQMKASKRRES